MNRQLSKKTGQKTNKKIIWCLQQKKGIELVEPNENLSEQYFQEAEETLQQITNKKNKWEVIMAYYACYHALYAILMKAGIKCEIHDCSIELMRIMTKFSQKDYLFLSALKEQRIRAQYYLRKEVLNDLISVKKFAAKCRKIAEGLDIGKLRGQLNE